MLRVDPHFQPEHEIMDPPILEKEFQKFNEFRGTDAERSIKIDKGRVMLAEFDWEESEHELETNLDDLGNSLDESEECADC